MTRLNTLKFSLLLCILNCALCISSCSLPNLEPIECSQARDQVKRFYSFHFANGISPTKEKLNELAPYLTPRLFSSLWAATSVAGDHFTTSSDFPRSFRVGSCTAESPEKTTIQVILLWKDDTSSKQEEIAVDVVKQDDKWLVDGVSPAKAN